MTHLIFHYVPFICHKDMPSMTLMSTSGMTWVCFTQFPSLGHIFEQKLFIDLGPHLKMGLIRYTQCSRTSVWRLEVSSLHLASIHSCPCQGNGELVSWPVLQRTLWAGAGSGPRLGEMGHPSQEG